jgi:hypothetical protein
MTLWSSPGIFNVLDYRMVADSTSDAVSNGLILESPYRKRQRAKGENDHHAAF